MYVVNRNYCSSIWLYVVGTVFANMLVDIFRGWLNRILEYARSRRKALENRNIGEMRKEWKAKVANALELGSSLGRKLTQPMTEAEPQPTRPLDTQQGYVASIVVQALLDEQAQVWRKWWKAGERERF